MIRKYLLTLFLLLSLVPNSYAGLIIDGTNLTASVSVQSNTLSNISGSGATLLNITFYDTEITVDESCTITNVIGYNTLGSDIVIAVGKTVTGTTNIFGDAAKAGDGTYTDAGGTLWDTDPLFVSETDFNLKPKSLAIKNGTKVFSSAQQDLNGNWVTDDSGNALPEYCGEYHIGAFWKKACLDTNQDFGFGFDF